MTEHVLFFFFLKYFKYCTEKWSENLLTSLTTPADFKKKFFSQYNSLRSCCASAGGIPLAYCNFSQFIDWDTGYPKKFDDPAMNQCAEKVFTFSNGQSL